MSTMAPLSAGETRSTRTAARCDTRRGQHVEKRCDLETTEEPKRTRARSKLVTSKFAWTCTTRNPQGHIGGNDAASRARRGAS